MEAVQHPQRRTDVKAALAILAAVTPAATSVWPGLTEAVHWLIDDTWWDERDPAKAIGTILRDEREAKLIRAVNEPLLAILNELGPHKPDREYLTHPSWPEVARAARQALTQLNGSASAGP